MSSSVGYKKPPKKSQFKKGQSGNPHGRPKKDEPMAELLQAELKETVQIQVNGKTKKLSKQEALIKRLTHMALEGDTSAMKQIFSLILSKIGDPSQLQPIIFRILNKPPRDEK